MSQAVLFCSPTVSGWPILYVSDEWCKACGMLASSVLTQPLWTLFEPQTCLEVSMPCRLRLVMRTQRDAAGVQGSSHQMLPDKLLMCIACAHEHMHMQGLTWTPLRILRCTSQGSGSCHIHLEWAALCPCTGPVNYAAGQLQGAPSL